MDGEAMDKNSVSRGDYAGWCRHYQLDPNSDQAKREWEEARRVLATLQEIDAKHEVREVIHRAKKGEADR
ncbi:hypothetical protein CCR79_13110 [Halorhodospira halophila]|nr:hypothetical protein [Halorhodospira halophila]